MFSFSQLNKYHAVFYKSVKFCLHASLMKLFKLLDTVVINDCR